MRKNKDLRLKIMVMDALKFRRATAFDFSKGMSMLESFLRAKVYQDALLTIRTYSRSKKLKKNKSWKRGFEDMMSILTDYHFTRLRRYFTKYKNIVKKKSMRDKRIR